MGQGVRSTIVAVAFALVLGVPAEAAALERWYEVRVRSTGNHAVDYDGGRRDGTYGVTWDWQVIGLVRYTGIDFEPRQSIVRYHSRQQSDVGEGGRLVGCRGSKRPVETMSRPEGRRRAKGRRGDFVLAGELALDDGTMFVATEHGPPARNCDHGHPGSHGLEGLTGYGEEAESPIVVPPSEFDPRTSDGFSSLFKRELKPGDPHEPQRGVAPHGFSGATFARVTIKQLSAATARRRERERARLPGPAA